MKFFLVLSILMTGAMVMFAQSEIRLDSSLLQRKNIQAIRTAQPPRIDGNPGDSIWKVTPVAGNFLEYMPRNATLPSLPTEIRFAFDDVALYILAIMYDNHPDSICREMGRRDQIESLNNDYISFDILPYNDGLNMYEFKVSPANLQNDCKYSAIGQDLSWDAVWQTATLTTDTGWIAEVRIPWSALRFSKAPEQIWGINMWRNLQRYQEYSTWSWVDNKNDNIFKYYGTLTGIRNINPPLRLSFSPYVASYQEKVPDNPIWSYSLRGGLDLRYGINESYTLDMMLIPDFGQVQSDDQVLNLTPFEIQYDEKRQFFTEGTELFDKCEIFYTRRVGSMPRNYGAPYDSLKETEKVTKNPDQTRIINATKISGRNARGLGIGFFNGMTTNTWAEIEDTVSGTTRRIMTQPFTNYNVLVFDQNLKNNSYVTLINTNYYTPDERYWANVTGAETQLKNGKNTLSFFGRLNVSQHYTAEQSPVFGHQYIAAIGKPSGKFQAELLREVINDTYDPNDMGFLINNNEVNNRLQLSWKEMDPRLFFLNNQTFFEAIHSTLYKPDKFKMLEFSLTNVTTFKNFWSNLMGFSMQPLGYRDFYEPRVWGWEYDKPLNFSIEWRINSDGRKPFRYQHTFGFTNTPDSRNFVWYFSLVPRFRFSDRWSATLQVVHERDNNNYGWVATSYDMTGSPQITFGRRDIFTFNNILSLQYIFNTKGSFSLRARHYWSQAKYLSFYTMREDGSLSPAAFRDGEDINFNAISADAVFVWYFAPGSEVSFVWKSTITTWGNQPDYNYFRNFSQTLDSPQTHSLSVKVLYYLDFQQLTKKGRKTTAGTRPD
jgi:hypothetical protein